jgi:hypothetical protein
VRETDRETEREYTHTHMHTRENTYVRTNTHGEKVKTLPQQQLLTLRKKFMRYSTNNKYSVGLRMRIEEGEENVLFHS